ncbi:hypothetical protein [Ideonella sp. YS5]|uniref:hypothetical protein n=1 Tax=Ideonella sp. YS5 TaxID=3453714 RepID=UPI003EE834A2
MLALRFLLISLWMLLLAGCDQQAWFDRFVPKEESEVAKQVIAAFGSADFATIERQLDPSLAKADTRARLQQIADQFPAGPPKSIQVVGAHTMTRQERITYDLTFQYEYPDRWLLANVVLQRENGQLRVAGIHVNRLADSLQNQNRFTFAGKGVVHWVFFALAIAIPLFIVVVLVLCARTAMARRKWLWLLFVALGLVQISLNWSTGEWSVSPVAFMLLGAGFHRAGPGSPYILTIALPVGALLFLLKRREWLSAGSNPPVAQAAHPE